MGHYLGLARTDATPAIARNFVSDGAPRVSAEIGHDQSGGRLSGTIA
jgi:hypothetical protein